MRTQRIRQEELETPRPPFLCGGEYNTQSQMPEARHDWTVPEIESIYSSPLLDLLLRAQLIHREHHQPNEVQGCVLLNVKSGGCPEDCAYCPQSAHYRTETGRYDLMQVDEALTAARRAR